MADGAVQPDIDHMNEPENTTSKNTTLNEVETPPVALSDSRPVVIWTPRFIVIFALTLVLGLSTESLLTEEWLAGFYTGQWVFQAHVIFNCLCWLALSILARSSWIRIGGIFGCIWALFLTWNIALSTLHSDPSSPVLAHVNAATCIALLGSYICLSINRTPFSRLDAWFFGLAPIAAIIAVAFIFLLAPAFDRSLSTLESAIATTALVLSLLVWWIRPTSWKAQPGPAFLFGCVPLILLLLAIPNMGFPSSNFFLPHIVLYPNPNLSTNEANFFFSQLALLCLLLGTMRLIFCEVRN